MKKKTNTENLCNHPGCDEFGDYRAPIGYDNLNNYQWFCLDHIKEFNKKWNYHNTMNADQIENDIRYDTIWRRPTKPFGSGMKYFNFSINGEEMGSFENPNQDLNKKNKLFVSLTVLDLDINADIKLIKKRYKELVKKFHPDITGNSKKNIDKFRKIVEAYNYLLERYK